MNMSNLMAQAQKMQKDIQKKQEEIHANEYSGESELVCAILSGDKKIKKIEIKNKENLNKDDLEGLEDMIVIAVNNALLKIDDDIEKKMGSYGNALGGLF